jgi:hypothetical protein
VWCVEFHRQGVFIGVPGSVTNLIKLAIHLVLTGRLSLVAGRPSSVASTDSRPQVPFHHLVKSVTAKETHGRLQSGAGRPPTAHTLVAFAHGLLVSGVFWGVTLILLEFLISL